MGVYICGVDEIIEKFEAFLLDCEGEVHADTIAKAWNKLSKKNQWGEKLYVEE